MDWRLFSEVEPSAIFTGRLWIKPSTATVYIRMGSTWITMGSAGDVLSYKRIMLLINGIDKTALIAKDSLSIEDLLTKQVDTCGFTIIDSDGTNKPQVGQEVIIFYKTSSSATPVIRFGGRIDEAPQSQFAPGRYQYEIVCVDFTQELNRAQVVEVFTAQLAGDIIKSIIASYVPGLGTYYVQDGATVDYISFNYKYPLECITELCDLTGYDFYVDYERNIHFFEKETNVAPYELNETATSVKFKELVITVNKTELKNAVTVRGGYEFSVLYSQIKKADGEQTSFKLVYEAFAPITVEVDTGAGYVSKTLGIDNIDTAGKDFVINVSEGVIKNLDYATLSDGHLIRIKYKYKKPILAFVDDEPSIILMKQYEGGDGIYKAPLIVDETIETKAQAIERGRAELRQYSNPLIEGTFLTTQYGFRSGQILTINIPSRGINAKYLIQQVTALSLGMGNFEYEIMFATQLKGLTEFLIDLYDRGKKIFTRTDEILARLKIVPDEAFFIRDSVPTESRRNTTSDPYVWSNDAGTTPGKGQYHKASWG